MRGLDGVIALWSHVAMTSTEPPTDPAEGTPADSPEGAPADSAEGISADSAEGTSDGLAQDGQDEAAGRSGGEPPNGAPTSAGSREAADTGEAADTAEAAPGAAAHTEETATEAAGATGKAADTGETDAAHGSTGERSPAHPVPGARGARSRRVRRSVKVAVAVVVVLAFLALGDRWAVLYAENMAAQKMREALDLSAEPEVHIDGFPFLTQLATGGVDHVEATIPDVPAGRVSVEQVKGTVDDIRFVGSLPASVKGAKLTGVRGEVFLDFEDLEREVGASQVHFTPGSRENSVRARGEIPVAGEQAKVRAEARLKRTGDHGLNMSVRDTRVVVPGLLTYTPGKGGGLQLAAPAADKMDEEELQEATGESIFPDERMKGSVLDTLVEHPSLLEPTGVDPSLVRGLQKVREPRVAEDMEFSAQLPDDTPGDIRLSDISVTKDGVRAELAGTDVPLGEEED